MIDINFYVWEPGDWQKHNGFKVDLDYCRHSVSLPPAWSSYQCSFKRKVKIGGYGFCTLHANMLVKMGYKLDDEAMK